MLQGNSRSRVTLAGKKYRWNHQNWKFKACARCNVRIPALLETSFNFTGGDGLVCAYAIKNGLPFKIQLVWMSANLDYFCIKVITGLIPDRYMQCWAWLSSQEFNTLKLSYQLSKEISKRTWRNLLCNMYSLLLMFMWPVF